MIDLPARINRAQAQRPEEFCQIKPAGVTGDHEPLRQRELQLLAGFAHGFTFDAERHPSGEKGEGTKGMSGSTSRLHERVPRFHQMIVIMPMGHTTVVVLLNNAPRNNPMAVAYDDGVRASSNSRYARTAPRKKTPDMVFLSSLIQATDSV